MDLKSTLRALSRRPSRVARLANTPSSAKTARSGAPNWLSPALRAFKRLCKGSSKAPRGLRRSSAVRTSAPPVAIAPVSWRRWPKTWRQGTRRTPRRAGRGSMSSTGSASGSARPRAKAGLYLTILNLSDLSSIISIYISLPFPVTCIS